MNVPNILAQHDWSGWFGPAALLLAVVSAVLAGSVAAKGANVRISWTGLVRWIGSAAWAVPAVVVLGIVLHQSTSKWMPGRPRAAEPSAAEVPAVLDGTDSSNDHASAAGTGPVSVASIDSDPPEWIAAARRTDGESEFVVATSGQFATQEEAEADVLARAESLVRADFERTHGTHGEWTIPEPFLRDRVVRRRHVEQFVRGSAESPFLVRRLHAEVELSPAVRDELRPTWRRQIVEPRLWSLGTVAGLLALACGATAGYLRLDALTQGQYRRRLKAAAVGLIVSGGLLAARLLAA